MKIGIILTLVFVTVILVIVVKNVTLEYNNARSFKQKENFISKKHNEKPYPYIDDIFKKTRFSLECCPSVYSTDRGCACLTIDQQQGFANRGNNRNPHKIETTTSKDF